MPVWQAVRVNRPYTLGMRYDPATNGTGRMKPRDPQDLTGSAVKETVKEAGQDFLIGGITLAAILLLVGTGTSWVRSITGLTELIAQSQSAITSTLLLNIALILFGWRRFRQLQHEVARRATAEAEALALASFDPLTGLLNRRAFNERGDAAILKWNADGCHVGALVIDLDTFKNVNDLFGHDGGDKVIEANVARIRAHAPPEAIIARLGGDEFAIIYPLPRNGPDQIDEFGQKLAEELVFTIEIDGVSASTSASVGGATSDATGVSMPEILRHADAAMYRAKRLGRSRYCHFNGTMELALARQDIIESDLRRALQAGEPYPVYEPLVDLATGQTVGYEMLARWKSPVLGEISPAEFVAIAEQCKLIGALSEHLYRLAFADAVRWPQHLSLSVNVSPLQLRDPWFAQKMLKLMSETALPPQRLVIEITENALIDNIVGTSAVFTSLRNLGVRIALDDFGTGYSSIASLRSLPFDTVKLDREFVMRMAEGTDDDEMTKAVIALGQSLGLPVIAEGIESAAVAAKLADLGCAIGQGRRWGGALLATDLLARHASGSAAVTHATARDTDAA